MKVQLPPLAEEALARGLPGLFDLLAGALPPALSLPLSSYRSQILAAGDTWARPLLAVVLAPPTDIDASAGPAPVANVQE